MTDIYVGRDGLGYLGRRLGERGARRVLLLTSPSRRFVDRALAALEGLAPAVFDSARVHVPAETVDAAAAALAATGADAIVALGGGSAIGLGKALRLGRSLHFAAVPTTYAGSEMTSIYGITRGSEKTVGRDPSVRPEIVVYDPSLTADLPIGLTVQSLCNALAHVVSTLATDSLDGDDHRRALVTAAHVVRAIEDLLRAPDDDAPREAAQLTASAAGAVADRGRFGAQHALAHLLGAGLGLDHAAVHAVLLPRFVAHLRAGQPALAAELDGAVGRPDLETYLYELLTSAGAPVSLDELGADADAVRRLLATRPDLPAEIAVAAQRR